MINGRVKAQVKGGPGMRSSPSSARGYAPRGLNSHPICIDEDRVGVTALLPEANTCQVQAGAQTCLSGLFWEGSRISSTLAGLYEQ